MRAYFLFSTQNLRQCVTISIQMTSVRGRDLFGVFWHQCPKCKFGSLCILLAEPIDAHGLKIQGRVEKVLGHFTYEWFYRLGFLKREGSYWFEFYWIFINGFFENFPAKVLFLYFVNPSKPPWVYLWLILPSLHLFVFCHLSFFFSFYFHMQF